MTATIEISDLRRTFGAVTALDGIDLRITRGTTGLLGPNGAGKTTLLRILATATGADSGQVTVLGHDPRTSEGGSQSDGSSGSSPRSPASTSDSPPSSSSTTSPSSKR